MVDYSRNEIVDILLILGECRRSYRQAARLYRERYPNRNRHPNAMVISRIEQRQRQGPRRPRHRRRVMTIGRDDPRVLVVLAMTNVNPHISIRQIQAQTGIPRETVRRILQLHRFHPYHITLTHQLIPADFGRRLQFCLWARGILDNDPQFFRYVMFSDEATFHSDGQLNRHNSHYWSQGNPHWVRHIDHQHQWSLTTWCGIVNGYLIGPFFFDNHVNGVNYLDFLMNELPNLLDNVDLQTRTRMWFQHDGAPGHRAINVQQFLSQRFPNRWIGLGGQQFNHVEWPPRSPDLTSPDFFLWGYVKNVVFADAVTTRENMMDRIRNACQNIPNHVLLSTVGSFQRRVELCIANNGGIFEHLIR